MLTKCHIREKIQNLENNESFWIPKYGILGSKMGFSGKIWTPKNNWFWGLYFDEKFSLSHLPKYRGGAGPNVTNVTFFNPSLIGLTN